MCASTCHLHKARGNDRISTWGRDMPQRGSILLVKVCFSSPGCAQNLIPTSLDCLPYGEQEEQAKYTPPSSSHLQLRQPILPP